MASSANQIAVLTVAWQAKMADRPARIFRRIIDRTIYGCLILPFTFAPSPPRGVKNVDRTRALGMSTQRVFWNLIIGDGVNFTCTSSKVSGFCTLDWLLYFKLKIVWTSKGVQCQASVWIWPCVHPKPTPQFIGRFFTPTFPLPARPSVWQFMARVFTP